MNTKKPNTLSSLDDLNNFYWLRLELAQTCEEYGLPTSGLKLDLTERLAVYLKTGKITKPKNRAMKAKDSDNLITKNTSVAHYKNDAITREFFIRHIGKHFKFNAYLRQFTQPENITADLTYDDLIEGWEHFESNKSASDPIGQQFEYNQFIRDYFLEEKGPTMKKAICAWKKVATISGPNTYKCFSLVFTTPASSRGK